MNEFSNPTSERINTLIELLNEIEKFNNKHNAVSSSNPKAKNDNIIQGLLCDAVETVAVKTETSPHHIEKILNDIITEGDMRFNIVYFCCDMVDWLITGNRTKIKKVLTDNINENFTDGDRQAIEKWYSGFETDTK
ncbi:MAG: hypothetical protein K2O29_04115 [Ruminococcus sp.]|nr:hypothetical protein [Ruminococcus sp.]